jgi:DNA repair protein RadC
MKQHTRISAISAPDRPRERLLALGPRRLRNEELLAIVIGSGTRSASSSLELARTILKRTSGPAGLAQASLAALLETEGVGPAVAMRIVAGCELNRRAMRARSSGPLARAPAAGGPGSDSLRAADKRSVTGAA